MRVHGSTENGREALRAPRLPGAVTLAGELVAAIRADADALAELRDLLAPQAVSAANRLAPAYTVATLAAELGRSERSIRAAIARGELEAIKRGRGYVIGADAVAAWATRPGRPGRARGATRRRGDVMARALRP